MNNKSALKHQIENRRTAKVLGNTDQPHQALTREKSQIDELLAVAGNAPFHYACDRAHLETFTSPVPWRAYKLDNSACQSLMAHMLASGDMTKIPNMLAAAEFLIQVTWLPDAGTIINASPEKDEPAFQGTLRNMEHIAAASAFIQSLLLVSEEAGFKTYWSSGGPLRSEILFKQLNIPTSELLLGSVFLFPQDISKLEVKAGGMVDKRGELEEWSRWVM